MAVPKSISPYEEAKALAATDPVKAEVLYKEILAKEPENNEASMREYEMVLMDLGAIYRDHRFIQYNPLSFILD